MIGQDVAVRSLSRAIRRTRAGLKDPNGPGARSSSPPFRGRQDRAVQDARDFLFGDEDSLIQLDMSEYMDKHTVSRCSAPRPGTSDTRRAAS